MPLSNSDKSKLAESTVAAISPPSSSTAAVSDSRPSDASLEAALQTAKQNHLVIGRLERLLHLHAQAMPAPDGTHILVEGFNGGVEHVRSADEWTPASPQDHNDPQEHARRYQLWLRRRQRKGLSSALRLMIQYVSNDLTNCTCEKEITPAWDPPTSDDPNVWLPADIDRIGDAQRPKFEPQAAELKVDITAFFRADNDLGDGNNAEAASKELRDRLDALRKIKTTPTDRPDVPCLDGVKQIIEQSHSSTPSQQNPRGGH